MQQKPPIIEATPQSPVLPPMLEDVEQIRSLTYCKNICTFACILFLGASVVGFAGHYSDLGDGQIELWVPCLCIVFLVIAAFATVMLDKQKPSAYALSMIIFIVLLVGFPVGTLLGVLGLRSLEKGKKQLRRN